MRMIAPSAPKSAATEADMPRATPAWGSRVMPRYLHTCPGHCINRELTPAPMIFPAERIRIYTRPTQTTAPLAKTRKSSSAPESTKKSTYSGAVHRSQRYMISSEKSQRLQKMVPHIMHTSSGLKPMATPEEKVFSTFEKAVHRNTNATARLSRLERELKNFSTTLNSHPRAAPRARDATISMAGFTSTEMRFTEPEVRALAMPVDTAKTTRPTASSRATMGSSKLVRGPLALYWFTTIMVAAGAVAAPMAPRMMQVETGRLSPSSRCRARSPKSTKSVAESAWKIAITVA